MIRHTEDIQEDVLFLYLSEDGLSHRGTDWRCIAVDVLVEQNSETIECYSMKGHTTVGMVFRAVFLY